MTVRDIQDGKLITLSKAFDTRAKTLNFIYFVTFSFAGALFLNMVLSKNNLQVSAGLILFITIVVFVYLFAGYRFINKAMQTEKLFVNNNSLTISRSGLFSKHKDKFDINIIFNFRFLSKPEITKHPLAVESLDYLGFQTEQQVINEMHGDNRLAFDYNGRTIKFGENIYSWDFEQLESIFFDTTGKKFEKNDVFGKEINSNV